MSEQDDLLAQAKAIQAKKLAEQETGGDNELLSQARSIQAKKLNQNVPEGPSLGQTILDQGAQGVLAGNSDELSGVGGWLANNMGINAKKEDIDKAIGLRKDLANKPSKIPDYIPNYTDARNEKRSELASEKSAYPFASSAAELAGGIVPAIGTGGAVKAGAMLGGATGLGNSESDLADQGLGALPGALKSTAVGSALGAGGAKLGQKIGQFLNPESLETSASKLAQKAVKLNPKSDIPIKYDADAGRVLKQYGESKGIGLSSLNSDALPMTGGMEGIASANQDAITKGFQQLKPIVQSTQSKIEQNTPAVLEKAGNIGDKLGNYYQEFIDNLPNLNNKDSLIDKASNQFKRIEEIASKDGDLPALMDAKRELYQDAVAASKNIFKSVDPISAESEASFLKGMANVVKKHTEDLAGAVDPQAASQIKSINGNISNLINMQTAAEKQIGKESGSALNKLISAPTKALTGFSPGQLGKIGGAKALNQASKVVDTPIGSLVQKSAPAVTQASVNNPWAAAKTGVGALGAAARGAGELVNSSANASELTKENPTKIAASLYNATNDSLKQVADKLAKQPGMEHTANYLNKSINSDDNNAKNRAIFLIMQNPMSRKLVTEEQ